MPLLPLCEQNNEDDERNLLSERVKAMDSRIAADPRGIGITDEELKAYRRQIAEVEKHVLSVADVILCTCVESASKRIKNATNVQQVQSQFSTRDSI